MNARLVVVAIALMPLGALLLAHGAQHARVWLTVVGILLLMVGSILLVALIANRFLGGSRRG